MAVGGRTVPGGAYHAGALGDRGAGEEPVVVCGMGQKQRGRGGQQQCPILRGLTVAQVHEVAREAGPFINLNEKIGDLDARKQCIRLPSE